MQAMREEIRMKVFEGKGFFDWKSHDGINYWFLISFLIFIISIIIFYATSEIYYGVLAILGFMLCIGYNQEKRYFHTKQNIIEAINKIGAKIDCVAVFLEENHETTRNRVINAVNYRKKKK
jgi:hypothetical protein